MSATNFHAVVFVDAEVPTPESFHPEFGYLCPSARLRRKLRRIVVTVGTGMAIAAGTALVLSAALVPHVPGQGTGEEAMLPVIAAAVRPVDQAADRSATDRSTSAAMTPAIPVTAATDRSPVTDRSAPLRAGSCDDLAASFLMPGCQLGKSSMGGQARRIARASGRDLPIDQRHHAGRARRAAAGVATTRFARATGGEAGHGGQKADQDHPEAGTSGIRALKSGLPRQGRNWFFGLHGPPRSGIGPDPVVLRARRGASGNPRIANRRPVT